VSSKIALVSGSSRGIGKGIVAELAGNGFLVYVNGRDEKLVSQTVTELKGKGYLAKPLVADFTQESQIKAAITEVVKSEGKIDLLVANLGSGKSVNSLTISTEEVRRVFDINFFSAVTLCSHALPYLNNGQIVFISSIAGTESLGAPIAYSAAKAALLSYSKSLSDLAAASGVRVNTVSPGNVMFEGSTWDEKIRTDEAKVRSYIKEKVPMNTFAQPSDIAKAVLFLVNSPFITGQNIIVDGGQTRKFI
jgi:3-oxoacyl-[acyl-carrier protein] reductase